VHQGWLGVMLCRVTRSLVVCVCFVDRCLSFCTFSFGHCVVCSSSIYGFWLPLLYLQTLLVTPLHIYRLWRRTWLVAWLYDITTYLRTQRIENAVEGDIWKGTGRLLNQGILVVNIFTSKALYGHHHDFVNRYEISVSQMATYMPRLSLSQFGSVLIHGLSPGL
jgi:hypothetical protein